MARALIEQVLFPKGTAILMYSFHTFSSGRHAACRRIYRARGSNEEKFPVKIDPNFGPGIQSGMREVSLTRFRTCYSVIFEIWTEVFQSCSVDLALNEV